jgi:hypothetical protein
MAWFKADDRIMEHGKFIAARAKGGHAAIGVWFHAGTWANGQMTDGFIPRSWATLNGCEKEASLLVEVGLWDEDASRDGWQMHDYAEYQPLRSDLEAKSEQKRSAGQAGGKQSASRRQAERKHNGSERQAHSKPVPVPEPEPEPRVTALRVTRAQDIQDLEDLLND